MSAKQTIVIAGGAKPRVRYDASTQQYQFVIEGVDPGVLFGPNQPQMPFAQAPRYGAVGRQFDYQTGANLNYTPRGSDLVSFQALRALAEGYDLLRLCIETRKDQIQALDWKIAPKDTKVSDDSAAGGIMDALQYPDRRHDYGAWQRILLEEMLVTDAMCVYPHRTNGGDVFSLDPLDGATIFPLIDAQGRAPLPPNPSYQQIIKGLPSVDYTSEELVYRMRNPRVWKTYGYSPVEQIIITVNIALRRQAFQLEYYREGSVPDAFGSLPDGWNPQQIAEFQAYWDSLFENPTGANAGVRRKMRWGPNASFTFAKDAALKDEYDEWLARICCYCFNLPPTPFVKQMNRAVAETQQDAAKTEGLLPIKRFWKSFMNYLVQVVMKRPDLHYVWLDEEELDAKTASDIEVAEVNAGIITVDEARDGKGRDPLPDGRGALPRMPTTLQIAPSEAETTASADASVKGSEAIASGAGATGAQGVAGATGAAKGATGAKDDSEAVEKLAKRAIHAYVERRPTMIQRQRLTRAMKRTFRAQAANVSEQYGKHIEAMQKAATDDPVDDWFDYDSIYAPIPTAVYDPLNLGSQAGVQQGGTEIGVAIEDGFVNQYSADYAKERGAEMIGKKWVDGELVDNPDAKWTITSETRDAIRGMLGDAIEQGWTVQELSDELAQAHAFSAERADTVARTEMRLADAGGRAAAWRESGVVTGKLWLIGDDDPCQECIDNADAGTIDLEEDFPSGDDSEPAHPNCNCVVSPVVGKDEE